MVDFPWSWGNLVFSVTKISCRYARNRGGLPFNKYSWLTTHNSFSIVGEPSQTGSRVTFYNQEDTVTDQLNNGVRGFMLDMYEFLGDIWLCHSFGGVCYNYTAFEPAINTLKEIEAFLAANPTEIITIFIEDYVTRTQGLSSLFTAAGLTKYWFPVSSMPKAGGEWPTVTEMISKNYRLLVFTSNRTKEASEGIAYNWKYVNENHYGDGGLHEGNCSNRAESMVLSARSQSLVLVNFFSTNPAQDQACTFNSAPLLQMLPFCYSAAGSRWPNYLAVDFYKRSDAGGVFAALDKVNAGLLCGCSDISACKLNLSYGVCPNTSTSSNASDSSVHSSSPAPMDQNANSRAARIHCNFCVLLLQAFTLIACHSIFTHKLQ
ncbi:hypothetical protein L7F22_029663 [Adiantum nelumboides]|nr:hypothetical protein [Adiantum nelumboides]